PAPTPVFRSTVDLVAVDVQVVSRDGDPVGGLGIDDFDVEFNGHQRRIVSVDFIRKQDVLPADAGGPDRPIRTPGFISPDARLFVLAIDTSSFLANAVKPAMQGAKDFVSRLQPDDLVAVYV